MIKIGVVGLGMMGQHHARVYSQLGCELIGVADANIERAREIGERYRTRYYSDYAELIPQVDAVSIAVPTTLHRQIAMDFIRQGVHCLVEKPIASNLEEAGEMIRGAEENHVKLAVGHIERFNPAVLRLKQIIDQGTLGKLMIISTRRVGPFASRIRDVGIIIDSATHDIDIARYLTGKEPVVVFSKAGKFHNEKEDHGIVILDFGDITGHIEVNWFTPHKVRSLVATGSEGIAYLDYIEQELTVHNSHGMEMIKVEKAEPLKLELEHFLQCVQSDTELLVNGYDGLITLDIALQAEQAGVNVQGL
ncbi:MAG TPA: Gfo/Idh/MocA family oxidoreductase [Dehalococcoidia bacterium]|nr:Gfo/Idh/MocA family oxidoreductase [Dehalococcoidia bacterium]